MNRDQIEDVITDVLIKYEHAVSDPYYIAVATLAVAAAAAVESGHGELPERRAAFLAVAGKAYDQATAKRKGRQS